MRPTFTVNVGNMQRVSAHQMPRVAGHEGRGQRRQQLRVRRRLRSQDERVICQPQQPRVQLAALERANLRRPRHNLGRWNLLRLRGIRRAARPPFWTALPTWCLCWRHAHKADFCTARVPKCDSKPAAHGVPKLIAALDLRPAARYGRETIDDRQRQSSRLCGYVSCGGTAFRLHSAPSRACACAAGAMHIRSACPVGVYGRIEKGRRASAAWWAMGQCKPCCALL